MFVTENTQINKLIIHKVGNSNLNEGVIYSDSCINLKNDSVKNNLLDLFINSFKYPEYFSFYHDKSIFNNIVYNNLYDFFNNGANFVETSKKIASYLYEVSNHPRIKKGDFYFLSLENVIYNGEITNAIGIFKIENYDTFVKVEQKNDLIELVSESGINTNKTVDKGCIVFNNDKENGYVVMVVDPSGKGNDAKYWTDIFLNVKVRANDFLYTSEIMNLCKNYVTEVLPEEFEVSRADQADILNKGLDFFKQEDFFDFDKFSKHVFEQPQVIESFNNFKKNYSTENDIQFKNEFEISDNAVKKNQRYLRSVIKLDKNFHIYIHGKKELIERGYDDENKMYYYKLFFKDEM